ncbi:heterokaryon incompatibility protein-domain-containing protein [Aspergillus pseudotamarii]|uniref:Heterokaryon incompatibility protein-domain-containing protein n=1 Tax=Aspergillus pseudotamarii TaxID=132259 RepID=A0A5N6SPB8_ASPPS|nr:heterokaryon incompatibility protein-domain-containing protein [Aspergillus pseudotamarii]KAE8136425.1 heterokaryon incompatibility protein-domain-containing protein [Aspergillus pseudotamarii]
MSERFEYDPLPEPTCIRLVSFVPQDGATCPPPLTQGEPLLQLSLCTVDLRDAPHYEALSYTWGSPFPPEDSRSSAYDDENNRQRVIVNGNEHEIGRNLWEFLNQQQQTNANLRKEAARLLATGLDTNGRTPLMRAVIDRRVDLAEALLALGAETEAQDKHGKTALHYALPCSILDVELAGILVYHGADIYARTQEGKTPLDNAKEDVAALIKSLSKDLGGKGLPRGLRVSAQRPMWIDSISINQKDTAERNEQVAMMSDIYSKAMSVVVWLGVEDEHTPLALKLLNSNPTSWLALISVRELESLVGAMKERCSPKEILEALAFEKLVARTWWSRTWVIQELALAKRTLIVCGPFTTHPMRTAYILCMLCYVPSLGLFDQVSPAIDGTAAFESALFSGVHGIEALMLADISFRASAYSREREFFLKMALQLKRAVPKGFWGQRLSLQNLGRLSWWSQARDPRDKVFALVGIARPDPQDQRIIIDYTIPTDKLFVQYGHLFMQGSPEPIQDLHIDECYFFEPLEGLAYVQDTQNPHPEFKDYKAKLPSWTPNFSANLATCRIWSRKFSAALGLPNSPKVLRHSDPKILCVSGHIVDDIIETEPTQNRGDVHQPQVMAWLELIQALHPMYRGRGNCVDALWQTLTVGKLDKNRNSVREASRAFMLRNLSQSPMNPQLKSILTNLRKSGARKYLPSFQELLKQEQILLEQKKLLLTRVPLLLKTVDLLQGRMQRFQENKQELLKLMQELQTQEYTIDKTMKWLHKARHETEKLMQKVQELGQEQGKLAEVSLKRGQRKLEEMQDLQLVTPEYSSKGIFDIYLKRYYRSRCLFRTRKGYIGLGPVGVQPGDEIWLFATARTPFILRRPSEGPLKVGSNSSIAESECRTFIGETYVHGIMNGEAMRNGDFRPVSLI